MLERNQAVLDFLLSRRSRPAKTLVAPAPDAETLDVILTAAARTPDHGKLEPWRFIVLTDSALPVSAAKSVPMQIKSDDALKRRKRPHPRLKTARCVLP